MVALIKITVGLLADAARFVFDAPATPGDHRTQFLRACFARLTI